jgi:hypothetical protein
MMPKYFIPLALLLPLSIAYAGENALFKAENSCLKYPPSDARTECMRTEREAAAESEKERQREKAAAKSSESGRPKKNDLCFTRKATGERVCPN